MPKDGQGSFSSKHCHDNYWYYVHPKNGMASLDMSEREREGERGIPDIAFSGEYTGIFCKVLVLWSLISWNTGEPVKAEEDPFWLSCLQL